MKMVVTRTSLSRNNGLICMEFCFSFSSGNASYPAGMRLARQHWHAFSYHNPCFWTGILQVVLIISKLFFPSVSIFLRKMDRKQGKPSLFSSTELIRYSVGQFNAYATILGFMSRENCFREGFRLQSQRQIRVSHLHSRPSKFMQLVGMTIKLKIHESRAKYLYFMLLRSWCIRQSISQLIRWNDYFGSRGQIQESMGIG